MKRCMVICGVLLLAAVDGVSMTNAPGHTPPQYAAEAAVAMSRGDYAAARAALEEAVALKPDFAEALVGLGNACAMLGDAPAARKAYERALKLHEQRYAREGHDPNQLQQQVHVLLLLGREAAARDLLADGLKRHPESKELQLFNQGLNGLIDSEAFKKLVVK